MKTIHLVRVTAAMLSAAMLGACAGMEPVGSGDENDPYIITIKFSETPCKVSSVSHTLPNCKYSSQKCVRRNDFLQWESDPDGIKYEIYFDPLTGAPLVSNNNGILKRRIDADAPFAEYKYSIVKNGCNSATDTYDPRFRVDN